MTGWFDISLQDVTFAAGGFAVGSGLFVGASLVHAASPKVAAWFAKEKTTLLALEDKMKTGFGAITRALSTADSRATSLVAALRDDFSATANLLHADTLAVTARVEVLEKAVLGHVATPPTAPPVVAPVPAALAIPAVH